MKSQESLLPALESRSPIVGRAALPLEALGAGPSASSSLWWPQASSTSASVLTCGLSSDQCLRGCRMSSPRSLFYLLLQTLFSGWGTFTGSGVQAWTHLLGDTVHPTAVAVSVGEMSRQRLLSELCPPSRGHHPLPGSSCQHEPASPAPLPVPHEGCVGLSSVSHRAWQGFVGVQRIFVPGENSQTSDRTQVQGQRSPLPRVHAVGGSQGYASFLFVNPHLWGALRPAQMACLLSTGRQDSISIQRREVSGIRMAGYV